MMSRGWILETAPGWALSTPPEMLDLGVPDDVRRLIETQLYRLSPAERALLEAASVAGNEIATSVVAAALGCEVDVAERHCETLARTQHFLRAAGTVEWPDGGVARRYRFTHELHRQVVYEEIPEGRRARLHERIGAALETAYGARAVEIAPQLAAHFQRGRDPMRALRYLAAAGARARQRFASREAIGYLEPALAMVARLPDADERRRWELEVRLALGRALADMHGFGAEPVRENYERVAELCAAPVSAAQLFEVLYARWYLHALRAERDEAIALAAELDTVARRLDTADELVLADSVLVRTAFYDGRFTDAQRHMESLRARQSERRDPAVPVGYGVDPVIAATMHYAGALWFLGDPEGARTTARAGLARARESGNPFFLSAALGQAALVDLLCRRSRGRWRARRAGGVPRGAGGIRLVEGVRIGGERVGLGPAGRGARGEPCDRAGAGRPARDGNAVLPGLRIRVPGRRPPARRRAIGGAGRGERGPGGDGNNPRPRLRARALAPEGRAVAGVARGAAPRIAAPQAG